MGQKAKNAGKKKTKIQEPKLATEHIGPTKIIVNTNRRFNYLSKKAKSQIKDMNNLMKQIILLEDLCVERD